MNVQNFSEQYSEKALTFQTDLIATNVILSHQGRGTQPGSVCSCPIQSSGRLYFLIKTGFLLHINTFQRVDQSVLNKLTE